MGLLQDILDSQFRDAHEKAKRKQNGAEEPSLLGAFKDPQFRQDVKRGLLDSLNRGAVASTIGGPVDLATLALRPLGYNVEKPVLGSEWVGDKMQQLGLLGDTRNPIAEAIASVAVPGAMTKAGQGLFKAEQAAIKNAQIAGPLSDSRLSSQRGVFGGLNAKTADKAKLAQAEQMLNKGVDPAQVWKETGWGRGPDGKWRFEISDDAAKLTDAAAERFTPGTINTFGKKHIGNVPATLDHPSLIDNYPQWMKDIEVRESPMLEGGSFMDSEHFLDPSRRVGIMNVSQSGANPKSTMLHELQHAIQQREGFARGGSPFDTSLPTDKSLGEEINKLFRAKEDALKASPDYKALVSKYESELPKKISRLTGQEVTDTSGAQIRALDDLWPSREAERAGELEKLFSKSDLTGRRIAYERLGGEAEARLVQSRMNLTPEQRLSQYPWDADYFKQQTGVGLDDLIHRFDGGEAKSIDDYAGMHRPPMKDNGGAPLHDLTGGGEVYPDDIYSPKAVQYYGTGDVALDRGTIRKINAYKGNPDAPVTMYRAVPSSVPESSPINNGDWVTINPDYAKMHGESALGGDYRILQQQVPARKLFTNGDSIHEFGYDESGKISLPMLGALGAGAMPFGLLLDPENRAKLGF